MFWEYAPPSSMTLNAQSLPTSMQYCANQNARCIQRILWAFPKV
jgi:hypothetical protein